MAADPKTRHESAKHVYLFGEVEEVEAKVGGGWDEVRACLGGKGANLAEMTRIGIPVPPGFTVTTEACLEFLESGRDDLPEYLWEQEVAALRSIEKATGRKLGDPRNALFVSCRSGARFSMPGMMDTILNIGLNAEVARGCIDQGRDARFIYDSFRRLVQMFGSVVLDVPDSAFEEVIAARKKERGVSADTDLGADDWMEIVRRFEEIVRSHAGREFPMNPLEQLRLATVAVFKSWQSRRAVDYRNAAGIPHDLGTAVNIQAMVFGNMGETSGTGVAMTRNASTGEPKPEGDFLINAQGEDVVAGIRATRPLSDLQELMPDVYEEFHQIAKKLEKHYRNMQDMEFTIEQGKLWLLQTRDGKRTAQAEVRIATDMVDEGLIDQKEAVRRVRPEQVDFFLHPQLEPSARSAAKRIARGLNVSPGAAVGIVAFDADRAERWAKTDGKDVIMVRPETKPDDVHGMLAAKGVLTSRGGRTSHAALVARQFGKPAVVGVQDLEIGLETRRMTIGGVVIEEGEWISIDGTSGEVFQGKLETFVPKFDNPWLLKVLGWADELRKLDVRANADYPADAKRAREYGAQGIGLCRTEHMFFEAERLPIVQQMIMARTKPERVEAVQKLLPFQQQDFEGLFRAMDGLPVIIRLLDPPLHEFLPAYDELTEALADLKIRLQHATDLAAIDGLLREIEAKDRYLARVETLREQNPMLGTRGVRLGILLPELIEMQGRAVFQAACRCAKDGVDVHAEVMIPLTSMAEELRVQRETLEKVARQVMEEQGVHVEHKFGTMIEIPRAAMTADQLASHAEFFSFGTNDLTQTTFGISRDDAEAGFLVEYLRRGILERNPFDSIDVAGVGKVMETATRLGRSTRPDLEIGICGEHGGDPASIAFCHRLGLDYVSCSPFRVPIARLAAAHAALQSA